MSVGLCVVWKLLKRCGMGMLLGFQIATAFGSKPAITIVALFGVVVVWCGVVV